MQEMHDAGCIVLVIPSYPYHTAINLLTPSTMRYVPSTLSLLVLSVLLAGCGSASQVNVGINGDMHVTTSEGTATMGNTVPSDWPSDAPIYAGAQVTYSASVNPETGKPGMALILTTGATPEVAAAYYKKELVAQGWKVDTAMEAAGTSIFSAKKDSRMISLLITNTQGQTTITMSIEGAK